MIVTYNENIIPFDCDDTIVKWNKDPKKNKKGRVKFKDPYSKYTYYLKPMVGNIELLQKYKGRGFYIILWSAAGVKWAETIAKNLKLEKYIDEIKTKPCKYVDDAPVEKWFGHRVYLK